jgi:hypothetical protein
MRQWSVRHSRGLAAIYGAARRLAETCEPLVRRIGYGRLERPVAWFESAIKGALFDCRMCGQCVLNATGMSCPLNCPKQLRNGPCGGVRPDGGCEIDPSMRCAWVAARDGAKNLGGDDALSNYLEPIDHRQKGSSAWLRMLRDGARPDLQASP